MPATLATLVVDGDAMTPQPLPTTLLPIEDLSTLSADEIDGHRQITFQIKPPINPPVQLSAVAMRSFFSRASINTTSARRNNGAENIRSPSPNAAEEQ